MSPISSVGEFTEFTQTEPHSLSSLPHFIGVYDSPLLCKYYSKLLYYYFQRATLLQNFILPQGVPKHIMGWVKKKFLGKGAFGSVFQAQSSELLASSRSPSFVPFVALKTALASESMTLRFEKEIYDRIGPSNYVLKCFESSKGFDEFGREEYYLVLEYASMGTLKKILETQRISELEASYFAKMILKGLNHVHQYGFVHCDVKPDNILVFPSTNPLISVSLKLADFGRAKRRGKTSSMRLRGTVPYSSPENVISGEHEAPTDIWSFGCIMFQMLLGYGMWDRYLNANAAVLSSMIAGYDERWLIFPNSISTSAQDFLRRCLTKNPKQRWTAKKLLQHPFINHAHNWKTMY